MDKEEDDTTTNNFSNPIDTVDFGTAWGEYIQRLKEQKKNSLCSLLEKGIPAFANANTFIINVPNTIMAGLIEDEKQYMLIFLRGRTGNTQLNLQMEILAQTEVSGTPYTNKEKFDSLARKNPTLIDLVRALDLEIE